MRKSTKEQVEEQQHQQQQQQQQQQQHQHEQQHQNGTDEKRRRGMRDRKCKDSQQKVRAMDGENAVAQHHGTNTLTLYMTHLVLDLLHRLELFLRKEADELETMR
jgi:hypothetical protein